MESQLQRPHDHHLYEEVPRHHAGLQPVSEGEGETGHHHNHHGEKKSVLTKVKNKAKKIKDKIKHAGHAHEGDEDEETVNASQVHAAPMVNESKFISGTAPPKQTGLNSDNPTALPKETDLNLENPANPLEDRQSRIVYDGFGHVGAGMGSDRRARNEMYSSIGSDQVIETSPSLEDPYTPNTSKADYSGAGYAGEIMARLATRTNPPPPATFDSKQRAKVAEPTVRIGPLEDLEEDTRLPLTPNYQTKVADPTGQGGAEVDISPLVDRLDNLHVGDEYEYRKTGLGEMDDYTGSHDHIQKTEPEEMVYTGSHDQFSPQPTPTSEQFVPKSLDAESLPPRDTVAEKISAATSAIADKASSAKDVVTSKLGYGHGGSGRDYHMEEPTQKGALGSVSHVVVEKLAPVYEKVKAAGAGSAIMSKMQRGGGGSESESEGVAVAKESDRGVSVQEYLVEKFSPGEEDRELSKVISSAIRGEGQQPQVESITVEAVVSDEKAAPGVVDRAKGAIGTWLGKNPGEGEGLEKEIASNLQE